MEAEVEQKDYSDVELASLPSHSTSISYLCPLQEQIKDVPLDEKIELNPKALKILHEIGSGNFSAVFFGLLDKQGAQIPVAVKRAQRRKPSEAASSSSLSFSVAGSFERRVSNAADDDGQQSHNQILLGQHLNMLKEELKLMAAVGFHPNVLSLIGAITTSNDDFCLVTEYCEYGSLDRFLRSKKHAGLFHSEVVDDDNTYLSLHNDGPGGNVYSRASTGMIATSDLLSFALQIAHAMDFLVMRSVVHRDVALRNVLLKADFTLKVGDFGLSRMIGQDGYYYQMHNMALPIRSVAPEVFTVGRFSERSESWSFGIGLWELFTFSEQPPYTAELGEDVHRIPSFLEAGNRLKMPACAPKAMKILMKSLWSATPAERPNFVTCIETIENELNKASPKLYFNNTSRYKDYAGMVSALPPGYFDDSVDSKKARLPPSSTTRPPAATFSKRPVNERAGCLPSNCNVCVLLLVLLAMLLHLPLILLLISVKQTQTVELPQGETAERRFLSGNFSSEHSLTLPYNKTGSLNYWDFYGSAELNKDEITLTPNEPGKSGAIWNKNPVKSRNWDHEVTFRIEGDRLKYGADGIFIYYSFKERNPDAGSFELADAINGIVVVLDTWRNNNSFITWEDQFTQQVYAVVSNYSITLNSGPDGVAKRLDGPSSSCEANYRNKDNPTRVLIRYIDNTFSVYLDVDGKNRWQECFSVDGVFLPANANFGVAAWTGGFNDTQEVISTRVFTYGNDVERKSTNWMDPNRSHKIILVVIVYVVVMAILVSLCCLVRFRCLRFSNKFDE